MNVMNSPQQAKTLDNWSLVNSAVKQYERPPCKSYSVWFSNQPCQLSQWGIDNGGGEVFKMTRIYTQVDLLHSALYI